MNGCAIRCATLALALLASACSSSESDATTPEPIATGTPNGDQHDAAPPEEPRGKPGSHVWFDTSVSFTLGCHSFYDTWGPNAGPPTSNDSCWTVTTDALSAEQKTRLEAIVLEPFNSMCTSDGFSYCELTVTDANGSTDKYADTGCDYLKVDGATALLPTDAFNGLLPLPNATKCTD